MNWPALSLIGLSLGLGVSLSLGGCKGDDVQADDGDDGTDSDTGDGDAGPGDGDGDGEQLPDPGRVTVHRLNNAEYNNTVQDLFFSMVDWAPALEFPSDDHSFGFDNISAVQNLSPLHFELYSRTAETMVADALRVAANPELNYWEAEGMEVSATAGGASGGFWNLYSNGEVYATFEAGGDGTYVFATRAYAQQAGPDLAHLVMTIDNVVVYETDIAATVSDLAEPHEVELQLDAGIHKVSVGFTNDYYDADLMEDRNLLVDYLQIEGPTDPIPNPLRDMIVTCDPIADGEDTCLRQIIDEFVTRAWRRPLTPSEVEALMGLYAVVQDQGGDFEDAVHVILEAALTSPHFLFRVEVDPDPTSLDPHPVSDYELASRLSYFLWSSMPDAELFARAADGTLAEPAVLEQQVDRMLADPRSVALVDNFAGQWLYIRALDDVFKDTQTFPQFNDELRASMRVEMQEFFRSFITEARPMSDLLNGTTTLMNDQLAAVYGVEPVGPGWVEVDLAGLPRRGLLTSPGLMSVLGHPITTSPVKRGKWVLDQLLCIPPPPPPPEVDIPPPDPSATTTMREQLAKHREDPVCASCHDMIDPIGLAFENYDAIGGWRTIDKGYPIDASGELPTDGEAFADAVEMADLLAADEEFPHCTVRKTFIYALGRALTLDDVDYLEAIEADFVLANMRFPDLVKLIVTSEPFTARRGEPEDN
ncbi:DUF1592 domain-containing protein [Enhygromyxa salina]|uniref:DUF1592 domain-containing protein n=1 Tax=Enhygromyxa salina TaxID=215803 RepID=A0A2S9XWU2_9BACT|nr:DUF1592 domain-containing protein [Enhygromyxa salina]PRP97336.1 hypothetical protein ENSA7_66860 [Enhygromyxa salina]